MDAENWYESHGIGPALLLAPPGCGKTEHLARWVASLVDRGGLMAPVRVLGLTFSNKAKANLRVRLRHHLGPRWYRHAVVTNFHGFAFRAFQHHASAIGRDPLEIAPQRGWLKSLSARVVQETGADATELGRVLRWAKCGEFSDEEVLLRLDSASVTGAIEYETRLRAASRVDFDDIIRLGHLVLAKPEVVDLYRHAFGAVIVDEVQDLSTGQLHLVRRVGIGRTVFAGDTAQGIYGFAGAEPTRVLDLIREESPVEIRLDRSYRSSPEVLRTVSAIACELGGEVVESAVPEEWDGLGRVRLLRTSHVNQEAEAVVALASRWCADHPDQSVAVIARSGSRRRPIDSRVSALQMSAEIWDFPVHRPLIAELFGRHLDNAILASAEGDEVQELYNRCLVDLDAQDLDALDELQDAIEAISELMSEGYTLREVVGGVRVSSSPDAPVGPGLHLLNGHVGKGQQFDRVIVVGLEEAILPNYPAMLAEQRGDDAAITEELAVLLVMLSRARAELVITVCDVVPKWNGADLARDPSRFLAHLTPTIEETVDLRNR